MRCKLDCRDACTSLLTDGVAAFVDDPSSAIDVAATVQHAIFLQAKQDGLVHLSLTVEIHL